MKALVAIGPLAVSRVGLGCMGMSASYGPSDETEAVATLHEALELGITLFDTAEMYGPFDNEVLLGRAFRGLRERVVIASKFGFSITPSGKVKGVCGTPAQARSSCEASLKRLGVEVIDLYYLHRVDPSVPIEETVGALGELVKAGKVKAIGLSEVSAQTIRRAHATFPIAAVQSEYSLWERAIEVAVLPTCRELGIAFVPYSPLGRGFLTGTAPAGDALTKDDNRRRFPRFQLENAEHNRGFVNALTAFAAKRDATAAQIALAWVLAQGVDLVPIFGSKRRETLRDTAKAMHITLSQAECTDLAAACPAAAAGARYFQGAMKLLDNG